MRKRIVSLISIVVLLSLVFSNSSALAAGGSAQATINLVRNAGFEDIDKENVPTRWSKVNELWMPSTAAHSGKYSVSFQGTTPKDTNYYISQVISAEPGLRYTLSCWVKTELITGRANISLNYYDNVNRKSLGCFPVEYVAGTSEWKYITATATVPESATTVSIVVYVSDRSIGKAWFDDISVTEYAAPFDGQIEIPGYRGQVTGGSESGPVVINGVIGKSYLSQPLSLSAKITSLENGMALVSQSVDKPKTQAVSLKLPTADIPTGDYMVTLDVVNTKTSQPLTKLDATFTKVSEVSSTVSFRPDGIALVNNEPFFPLGVFDCVSADKPESLENLKRISDSGFNCVMNYGLAIGMLNKVEDYLNYADALDLKCIFSLLNPIRGTTTSVGAWEGMEEIVGGFVSRFKDNPALLAWYLNDEAPLSMHDRLLSAYRQISELDPNHPCYAVLNRPEHLETILDTTDVVGLDPYPIPNDPITLVSDWTDQAVKTGQPAWIVPQIFDWGNVNPDIPHAQPTLEQIRCMTYLALTHGATGLIYYSHHDLKRYPGYEENWANVTAVTTEVRQIIPWLVSAERGEFKEIDGLHTRYFQNGGQGLLIVVNPGEYTITGKIPLAAGVGNVTDFISGEGCPVVNNQIEGAFGPLEVRLYLTD